MNELRLDPQIGGGLDSPEERRAEIERLRRQLDNAFPGTRTRAVEQLVSFGADAVAPLNRALALPHADVRVAAAKGLGELKDPAAHTPLIAALQNCEPALGAAVATALGQIGDPHAQGVLIDLLKHRDLTMRAAAAGALGELEREESIPALMDAYQGCFVGRSAFTQRHMVLLVIATFVLLFGLLVWGTAIGKIGGLMALSNVIVQLPMRYFAARRAKSKVACAITDALVKIAEHNPRPELHRLVPELRLVARDHIQQEKATRDASLLAADRIEALTSAVHDLPVPSGTPTPKVASLPQPAEAPQGLSAPRGG